MKNRRKLLISLASLLLLGVCLFFVYKGYQNKADGSFTAEIVDLDKKVLESKKIRYHEGDRLEDLLAENFSNVVMKDGMLMSIGSLTTAEDWSVFISIYVDEEMSMYGINDLPYSQYQKISFVETEFVYE